MSRAKSGRTPGVVAPVQFMGSGPSSGSITPSCDPPKINWSMFVNPASLVHHWEWQLGRVCCGFLDLTRPGLLQATVLVGQFGRPVVLLSSFGVGTFARPFELVLSLAAWPPCRTFARPFELVPRCLAQYRISRREGIGRRTIWKTDRKRNKEQKTADQKERAKEKTPSDRTAEQL